MPMSRCVTQPAESRSDRNGDGAWDVWTRRLDRSDAEESYECSVAYDVDTTKDGEPDWHFIVGIDEVEQAEERIAKRRGN
jgi:hypothetical protein